MRTPLLFTATLLVWNLILHRIPLQQRPTQEIECIGFGMSIEPGIFQVETPTATPVAVTETFSFYKACVLFLKSSEGIRFNRYNCAAGYPTIGWGHCIQDGEHFGTLTLEEANELFKEDLEHHMNRVKETYPFLPTPQLWAMTLFAYNMRGGIRAAKGTRLEAALLARDYELAGRRIMSFNKAKDPNTGRYRPLAGLTKKRRFERALLEEDYEFLNQAMETAQQTVLTKIVRELNT